MKGFGADGLEMELGFWIQDPEEGSGNVRSDLNFAIWRGFQEKGVTIPFPQPIQVTAGERIRVRFQYEAGASMQSLGNAISATPWRRR
jgi:small-conductance mechanosensitive channel